MLGFRILIPERSFLANLYFPRSMKIARNHTALTHFFNNNGCAREYFPFEIVTIILYTNNFSLFAARTDVNHKR